MSARATSVPMSHRVWPDRLPRYWCCPLGQGVLLRPAGGRLAHHLIRRTAEVSSVPVVGVYETMPTPRYNYQSWMMAEVHAIEAAWTRRVD
jgi:hypothetical protein